MRVSVQRLRGVLIVVTAVTAAGLAGCDRSDDLFHGKRDAGLDAAGDGDDAGSEADAALPVEFLPDSAAVHVDPAACAACMQTECGLEIAACLEDPTCGVARKCNLDVDPAGLLQCEARINAVLPGEQRRSAPSTSTLALRECEQNCGTGPGEACETHQPDGGVGPADCVGAYDWPASFTGVSGEVAFSAWIRNTFSSASIAGLIVRVCSRLDPNCIAPADEEISDDEGMVWLSYAKALGVAHYLEIRTPTDPSLEAGADDTRILYFPDSPDFADGVAYSIATSTKSQVLELAKLPLPDADRGGILAAPLDCWRGLQAGVTLTDSAADAPATIAYGMPADPTLTATPQAPFSFAWVLNASAGEHELTFALDDGGTTYGRTKAFVRPGWVSYVLIPPLTRDEQAALDP